MRKSLVILLLTGITFTSQAQNQSSGNAGIDTTRATAEIKKMVSIGPGLIEFNLSRGQSKTDFIYIVNRKSVPYTFSVELKDFTYTEENKMQYIGTHHNSLSDWITLDKTVVEVGPESTEKILVTLNVPDNAEAEKEMKWVTVIIQTLQEEINVSDSTDKKVRLSMKTALGAGVQIYQVPPAAAKDVKLMSFEKINDTTCRLVCSNTGNSKIVARASVEFSSTESDIKETIAKEGMNILPGTKRNVDLVIPRTMPKGKYNVIAILDAGDDEVPLEAAQTTIEIN